MEPRQIGGLKLEDPTEPIPGMYFSGYARPLRGLTSRKSRHSYFPHFVVLTTGSASEYPEVMICYDGRREIEAPDSRWFEFTGKGAGRVKYGTSKAEARCREYSARYDAMKQAATPVLVGT